nr:MAG: hypothetical protein [Gammatorquevirus sp.]
MPYPRKQQRDPELPRSPLPRNRGRRDTTNTGGNHPAHQQAAATATAAQAKHLNATSRNKTQTTNVTINHWSNTINLFKPGFEMETEKELAAAFKRPVRKFKTDSPFYPWLPPTPIVPRVNFNLNYTF